MKIQRTLLYGKKWKLSSKIMEIVKKDLNHDFNLSSYNELGEKYEEITKRII